MKVKNKIQMDALNYALLKFFLNLALLILWFRETGIIRGDGPSGFGEVVFKAFINLASIIIFFGGSVYLFNDSMNRKEANFYNPIDIFITVWLLCFAILAVVSACGDATGYCRQWRIY